MRVDETAIALLGSASPTIVEVVEEKEEESPTATDCTTLALVDTASSQPALLSAENQNSGDSRGDCHEGTSSAAAKTLTQSEIFDWLDRADVGVCPPLWVIQYLLDSKYYASMRASITKFEQKWNVSVIDYQATLKEENEVDCNKARAARKELRKERESKLKLASMSGDNPGLDFLLEC
ncbi:MAG: hypothetical protein V7K21_20085 [Nostoc sp.]|uniref:hypothetical protein n=1 Tax=Nostoc sp. TaxID=1180 RepID=UPI002FF73B35